MQDTDYPSLYQRADALSIHQQKEYFIYLKAYLTLLVVGALLSSIGQSLSIKIIALGVEFLSIIIYLIQKFKRPLHYWYISRATAETIKSMTWKYIMCAEPFNLDKDKSTTLFTTSLRELSDQNHAALERYIDVTKIEFANISRQMDDIRNLSIDEKLKIYNRERIENQLAWYSKKSKSNHNNYIYFSILTFVFFIAILVLMLLNIYEDTNAVVGVLSTATAGLISWAESKQYDELSNSYSLAVNDITLLKKDKPSKKLSSVDFSNYIISSENAFSREHTQWIARKV